MTIDPKRWTNAMVPVELTGEDQLRNARRLCRDAIKLSCRDAILHQQLEELDGVPITTLSLEVTKVTLLELVKIATGAMVSVKVGTDPDGMDIYEDKPHDSLRLKALETLANYRIEEGKLLILARDTAAKGGGDGNRPQLGARLVTKEQLLAEETKQRALEKARKEQMT